MRCANSSAIDTVTVYETSDTMTASSTSEPSSSKRGHSTAGMPVGMWPMGRMP